MVKIVAVKGIKADSKGRKLRIGKETVTRLGSTYDIWCVIINDVPQGTEYNTKEEAIEAAQRY